MARGWPRTFSTQLCLRVTALQGLAGPQGWVEVSEQGTGWGWTPLLPSPLVPLVKAQQRLHWHCSAHLSAAMQYFCHERLQICMNLFTTEFQLGDANSLQRRRARLATPDPKTSSCSASKSTRSCPSLPRRLCLLPCVSNTKTSTLPHRQENFKSHIDPQP